MKKNLFFIIACMAVFTFMSCSSDEEESEQQNPKDEYVEVSFDLTGDFLNVENTPMRTVENPQTYYYIKLLKEEDAIRNDNYPGESFIIGYVGTFTDLKYARLKLLRGVNYVFSATALVEENYKIDVNEISRILPDKRSLSNSTIKEELPWSTVDIFNKFTPEYMNKEGFVGKWMGAVDHPVYKDKSVDRFYAEKIINVTSNEVLNMELKRFSYRLNIDIKSPTDGYFEMSCESPNFKYSVDTNDSDFYVSELYSMDGKNVNTASKVLKLKLEKFDAQGVSEKVFVKELIAKPNVETTLHVNIDGLDANNFFKLSMDNTPMGKEDVSW